MTQIHLREKEQFKKLFQQQTIDRIEDRFIILEVFLKTENHVTSSGLAEMLEKEGHRFDIDFIRDTLKLLCRFGFANQVNFDNGHIRYEHRHLGQHHDHMICTKCGSIIEFENISMENLQQQIAATHGFHMLQHKMEIYGICSSCLERRRISLTLDSAKPGERLVIKEFTGGSSARLRLLTMGLKIGDSVEVITNAGSGQVVVAVDFNRYAIGRGLAQKVIVQPVNS